MTQQEQQLLNGLVERVNGTQLPSKDAEAERLLSTALGSNPDALYVLCQTVLVQQFAMDSTQRQLTEARAEIDRLRPTEKPQEHGSFLGNLFGLGKSDSDERQPAPQPVTQSQPGYQTPPAGYSPVRVPAGPQYGSPQPLSPGYGYNQPGYGGGVPMGGVGPFGGGGMFGGGGGFLQGAMQTAAGVVAGEFAFRALEDVFHGFGGGSERSFSGGSETVNNYYGNHATADNGGGFGDRLRDADGLGAGTSPDIEDRRGESHNLFGSAESSGNDDGNFADSNDNSADFSDDGGGFDSGDSGGNDDNGF